MTIIPKTSTTHTGYLKGRTIRYIVLHYTAGTRSTKGTARGVASMFANPNNRAASADFIIDDAEIVQYNPKIEDRYTYAVGGARYGVNYTPFAGTMYGKCKNSNSISIEMCSTKQNKASLAAMDTDWSISKAVVDQAVELVRYLMAKYKIPLDRVIMHHHVTGKLCPQPWCLNTKRIAEWETFKARLNGQPKEEEPDLNESETRRIVREEVAAQLGMVKEPVFNKIEDVPEEWGRETIQKLLDKGILEGTGDGLGLSMTMLRVLVIMDRLGAYD